NFNGTLLAPNADSKTKCDGPNDGAGHLSGALIANSYEGGMEFGYRPYRGPSSIVPSSSGYGVPIRKVISGSNTGLAGATFEITDGDEYSNTFTSDANGDGYVNIPSQVDFSGETTYNSSNNVITKTYTIHETIAPTGFVKDDTTTYEITVTETIDINSMHKNADGTEIPSKVLTQVTSNGESFTIELEDIYDEVSGERTKRELTIGDEIYVIDIDKGDATNVYKRAKDSKDTSVTVLSSSGTLFTTVIETSGMSTMTEENGDVKTTNLVTEKIEKDFDYNISAVACTPNSANVDAELILYYKDDTKETIDISTNAFNWNTSEDGSFNEYWGQNNIEKKDVIGFDVNIKSIEKDFELYIKGSSDNGDFDWSNDIFSRTFNKDEFDNENGFTYSFGRQELPTDESERYEDKVVSYDVVTTDAIFSTEVNTYLTETWTKAIGIYDTETIAAFNENGYKSPTTFTTVVGSDNYEYKYDPETLMIMPQPLNTPTFENDYGLIFAKVDDEGKSVPGATIEVQHHYYDFDDNKWKWVPIADGNNILDGGSLTTIDLKEIKDEEKWGSGWNYVHQRKVYRFVETDTPAGYEIAVPIYFVKDDNTIYYKSSETEIESMPLDETDWTGWQSVDLTKNNTADRKAVEMVDIKISGAKIKLAKYDSDFKNTLEGATFKLYAGNGDLIYPLSGTFTIDDESLDLYAMLRSAKETEYDTKYVQNGYLKPGSYYLEEITAPDGYDAQGKFGFRVKSDYSIEAVDAGTPSYFNTTVGSGKEVWIYPQNAEGEKISVSNVTKIEIELNSPTSGKLALWEGPFKGANPTITDGTVVLDNLDNVSFEGFKIQNQNYNDGVDVKEVRIYGEEGSGDSTSRAYNLTQIAWNGGNISKINKLTLYYADGTNASKENVSWSGNSDWAMFDLNGLILNNVVGLTVDFEGTAKIFVQDNTWENILGSGVEASGTCSFGNTNVNTGNETSDSEPTKSEEETADLAVKVSGDTIKIPNKKSGDKITITVEKKWVNDDGFESLRPESIEVQLKRKKSNGSEDDEFNSDNTYKATLDSSNEWKKSWSGLDRYDGDETQLYTYYVAEINVNDNYTVSYDANSDGKNDTLTSGGTLKITNTLNTIDINIEKKWDKNGCDDAVIPNSIEVKVQFKKADDDDSKWADVMKPVETTNEDGEILSSQEVLTLKLTEKDNWSGEVKNLPDIYEYRFVEMNVPTGWESDNSDTAKKDDLSASITNTLMTGSLGVEKNWANDSAADRPENLTISLYRTTKAPTTASKLDTLESNEDTQVNQLAENAEEAVSTETYEDITVTEGETIVLNTGDEGRLVLNSEKTVEWNDTENDKVKVENGILTVLDEGITTVSATIDDTPTTFNVNVKIASVVPNVTGMQKVKDIETFVKSDKAWNADVTDLPLYSPDGKPYYYYIVEKYTGADGKTVTGNNCTYYSVNYSDAVTLIDNPSTSPTLSVTNEKVDTEGITLPEAGGSGTHNYYIAGICLIGMAGIFWVIRRRRTTK
ncbi:MAG: Cna B-type domain-containing protein, partial [Ruminococcus sp.]|nr:Cna B-type domain-containing protein [Ruminococcus sp.]